jgi:hypothetical protein
MARHGVSAALRERLGHEATEDLLDLMQSGQKDWTEHVLSVATERFERRLTQEIAALRVELMRELHTGLAAVRQEIAAVRVELIRWSFVFWIGQIAAMIGVLSFMLRDLGR